MTDNYQINDINQLLEQIGNIKQIRQNLYYICADLNANINQIANAWQSDTVDKESYLSTIQKDLQNLETLGNAVNRLNSNLEIFALSAQRISNNG